MRMIAAALLIATFSTTAIAGECTVTYGPALLDFPDAKAKYGDVTPWNDCNINIDKEIDRGQALSAALSQPAWLEPTEKFSITGGVGYSEGETAAGATGLIRLHKGLSGYAGGAVGGGGSYAIKGGARVGW